MPDQRKLIKRVPGRFVRNSGYERVGGVNGGVGGGIATNRKSQRKASDMMGCIEVMTQKVVRPDEYEGRVRLKKGG